MPSKSDLGIDPWIVTDVVSDRKSISKDDRKYVERTAPPRLVKLVKPYKRSQYVHDILTVQE